MQKRETTRTFVQLVSLFSLLLTIAAITPSTAKAQSDALAVAAEATSTASSTTVVDVPQTPVKWYESDWISGNEIDRGDFVVGPGRLEAEVKPGQSVVRYLTVTNRISANRTFKLMVEDVAGTRDGSSVQLLGAERGPYTLKDYITFPDDTFTLGLGERAKIPVTITIPADAEPGGHYGSVLVTTVRDDGETALEDAPGTRSPIIARIGTLFFVTVPGAVERGGETTELTLMGKPWWYEKGPIDFGIVFENTGSIHLNPYGELRITNMFGEEVGFTQIDPWFVLPKSLRTREITWDREFLLGRYKATVAVNRGYDDIIDQRTVTFWVLPWKVVGAIFVVLFVVLFAFRTFFRTFEFKRKGS